MALSWKRIMCVVCILTMTSWVTSQTLTGNSYVVRSHEYRMQTLDQIEYTFVNRGEFVFLQSEDLTIHIRTDYISLKNHYASLITAIAIQEKGNDRNSTEGMVILADGKVYSDTQLLCNTSQIFGQCGTRNFTNFLFMAGEKRIKTGTKQFAKIDSHDIKKFAATFVAIVTKDRGLNIQMTVNPGNGTDDTIQVHGLAGNVPQGPRGGHNRTENSTVGEFYDFGESWRVSANESIFNYTHLGGNHSFYNDHDPSPEFLENYVSDLTALFDIVGMNNTSDDLVRYNKTCSGNTACLLTIARYQNIEAGQAFMGEIQQGRPHQEYKDKNECTGTTDPCSGIPNTTCTNTPGSYICTCVDGLYKDANGVCKPASEIGHYRYYMGVNLNVNLPIYSYIPTLNDTEAGDLKTNLTKQLTGILNETFSVVRVTDVFYAEKKNQSTRVARAISGYPGYRLRCILYSTRDMNSTYVDDVIQETMETRVTTELWLLNQTYIVGQDDFKVIPDDENPICSDDTVVKHCDNTTTTCRSDRAGWYQCSCRHGFKKTNSTPLYCVDVDECGAYGDKMASMCIHGSCHNTVGGWSCMCDNAPYLQPRTISADMHRCQGDFQYIGNMSVLWIGTPVDNLDVELFVNATIRNMYTSPSNNPLHSNSSYPSNQTPHSNQSEFPAMSDVFVNVDNITRVQIQQIAGKYIWRINLTYIVHLGEAFPSSYVCLYHAQHGVNSNLSKTSFGGVNVIITASSIYPDTEYSICDIADRTSCDIATTVCHPSNGTYSCPCKQGFKISAHSVHYCTDVDECKQTDKYVCGGSGTCKNTFGGWACHCQTGYTPINSSTNNVTCQDIDECQDSASYICNGGQCRNHPGGWDCECPPGYKQAHLLPQYMSCIDVCAHVQCSQGTKCVPNIDNIGFTCSCDDGTDCTEIDEQTEISRFRTSVIVTGACLGGVVVVLIIVVIGMCRWRIKQTKNADQVGMTQLGTNGRTFYGNGRGFHENRAGLHASRYLYPSTETLDEFDSINSDKNSYRESWPWHDHGNIQYRSLEAPPSPKPDYEGGAFRQEGGATRHVSSPIMRNKNSMVRVIPETPRRLPRSMNENDRSLKTVGERKRPKKSVGKRKWPKRDYEPTPDYDHYSLNASRDSGLADGYQSNDEALRDVARDNRGYHSNDRQQYSGSRTNNTYC